MTEGSADPASLIEPVRLATRVRRPIADAFRFFTEQIGTWWPVDQIFARGRVVGVTFEGRVGGRIYERCQDGETADWGEVIVWKPPHRVVFTWHPGDQWTAPTEVEVRFAADGPDATNVELEHRGWERLGAVGPDQRASHLNGWPGVLARFQAAADAS